MSDEEYARTKCHIYFAVYFGGSIANTHFFTFTSTIHSPSHSGFCSLSFALIAMQEPEPQRKAAITFSIHELSHDASSSRRRWAQCKTHHFVTRISHSVILFICCASHLPSALPWKCQTKGNKQAEIGEESRLTKCLRLRCWNKKRISDFRVFV